MLSIQDFEAKWKEVDNVWVQFGSTKMLKKDQGWTNSYDCRFRKRHSSSSKSLETPMEKQRITSIREANLCEAQVTVTLKNGSVTIRKTHADSPNHTHDLRTSDIRKRPTEITEFVEAEAAKGYQAPTIKRVAQNTLPRGRLASNWRTFSYVRGDANAHFISAEHLEEKIPIICRSSRMRSETRRLLSRLIEILSIFATKSYKHIAARPDPLCM